MKRSILIIGSLLVLLAGALYFWASKGKAPLKSSVVAAAPATKAVAAATTATNGLSQPANSVSNSSASTGRFPFRLSNTKESLKELTTSPHAILLENALVDTSLKLDLGIPRELKAEGEPGAYIVQSRGAINNRFRSAVASAGGQIISYIPNNAYLVRLSSAGAAVLKDNAAVQAVLPYEPYYKLQPSLLGRAVEQQPLKPGTALELGLFASGVSETKQQLEALGAKIIGSDQSPFGPVLRVLAPVNWTPLARVPGVQVMEVAHQRVLANDLTRPTVGVTTDSQTVSNYLGLSGQNVLVQVNDSGVDSTHPDLTGRVFGPDIDNDTSGHGTHVAGIIAGDGTKSLTVTNAEGSIMPATNGQFRGMAPKADLLSFSYNNSDRFLQQQAALTNALISNNSWVYGGAYDYDLAAASYDAATRDALPFTTGSQPVLFVFAAGDNGGGNDDGAGGSADSINSPATAKNVITVGALELPRYITNIVTKTTDTSTNTSTPWLNGTDSGTQVAAYSGRGNVGIGTEGQFGRFKPDVVAPGTFLISTRSAQWDTNAFLHPVFVTTTRYTGEVVTTNGLNYYPVSVPDNAIGVDINITSNKFSQPFPTNMPIYVRQSSYPTTTNYDFFTTNNGVSIPNPDGGASYLQQIQDSGFTFAVGNSTNVSVHYDVSIFVYTTNDLGDYYEVLLAMDDALGGYYRYDSGTSMSAADVSGVLALMQDYFTNKLGQTPSPALLKAMLINGARSVGGNTFALTNNINFQGWGLVNLTNSLPLTETNLTTIGANSPLFFVDQSPTNALATGDRHTYILTLDTNNFANYLPLKATLVWTDPCGDPSAAIKLVNNLDLIITNLDTGEVYFGNDISPDAGYNLPWNTNNPPNLDSINNVENIVLPPLLGGSYSVTVVGRLVNVNAVTAQTNNVVQDYALVVSVGEGELPTAISSVTDEPIVSNLTGDQNITIVTTTNTPLYDQFAGENTPLLGTNALALGANTMWGTNGQVTLGMTNQWHFYVVTNTGLAADYTNAAFVTFYSSTLSIPRTGVYADNVTNATKPEGDIDLYVSMDPSITNLNPVVISNCLHGANNSRASLTRGGTEFVYYTNSAPGEVYYVGVKSEDHQAAEYAFLPVFTSTPFGQKNKNGDQIVNGLLLPVNIPDGNNSHPGVTNVFALCVDSMQIAKVIVTNLNEHENFGDLFGAIDFGGTSVVLNNHDGFGNTFDTLPKVYDDSRNPILGATNTDGPGNNLTAYRGKSALGPWILNEMDNSLTQTGRVSQYTLLIQPHRDLTHGGVIVTVPAGGWFIDYVDVKPGYTNLTFNATNLPPTISPPFPPLQMFEKFDNEPTLTDYDQKADLTNCLSGTYPTGVDPGNSISVGPPLDSGRYFIGLYNPSPSDLTNVFLEAVLSQGAGVNTIFTFTTNSDTPILDDAVSSSTLHVDATNLISSVNVGMVVTTARSSDLTFSLLSPTGQRILLMENRGGTATNSIGHLTYSTNWLGTALSSNATASVTNTVVVTNRAGILFIDYNFYTLADQMDVYYDGVDIYSSGLISGSNHLAIPFGPGVSTNLYIVMDQPGTGVDTNSLWTYTPTVVQADYNYLTFTDDTNLTQVPIKFAIPPYNADNGGTNIGFSDFESTTNGDYYAPTNIIDPFGVWDVPTNLTTVTRVLNTTNFQFELVTNVLDLSNNVVSVVTDPSTAQTGSNYLALGYGVLTRNLPFAVGKKYQVTYTYRGPGIVGWWRGEGNAGDSANPENFGNNGALIGRFNFPDGEVGQAFEMQDLGDQFGFAGTNTYVQIRQSSSLDVGKGGGFTVEGWINPTNLERPQPLVEWLAHVPTNSAVTNLEIVAGPVLDRATGHYYYLLGATNWATSELWAESLGGHLATVDTANEQNWIFDNFAGFGGTNRNLWIGLTNNAGVPLQFGWINGETNVTYTNWMSLQPDNSCGGAIYTAVLGATNAQPGLWFEADNDGFTCLSAKTNIIYGVAEVDEIQTNGVQFWISVTNTPGTTNVAFVNTNGCLYANIVDTNYVSHEIYSAPGLLESNVYQHVALTFNTNSGIAELFLNGTNVASTNLFMTNGVFTPFVPKTDGDVLLGRDMSRYTNNYYGGKMDEMSIYNRSLSAAEIWGIYSVSATATNGVTGKFDPTVTPAFGLAEAQVSLGDMTNNILAINGGWQLGGFTFTAESNSLPMTIIGKQPGVLLDSFNISEVPQGELYYLPEQELSSLAGISAQGDWTLQVWDNRVGAYVTNVSDLVSWQLTFNLETNSPIAASLPPQTPVSSTVSPGQIVYYSVTVPAWAHYATNILVSSDLPVDMFFNQTNLPTGSNPGDYQLLANATSGVGSPILATNGVPPTELPLLPGETYYLGVRNYGVHAASVVLEVDYDITALTNGIPYSGVLTTNDSDAVRYFSFDVSSNAYEASFQLLDLTNNADLVVSKGAPLPTLTESDYASFNPGDFHEDIYVLTNSTPVPLSAGTWYLGVFRRDPGPVDYTVLAKEITTNQAINIIDLTNGVPVNYSAEPGAALTNFFRFHVTNSIVNGETNYVPGLRFEVYNQTGNGDLIVQTNALPSAPPFFESSQNVGSSPELITIYTNSAITNLEADWYLGVPNNDKQLINYTIVAWMDTNSYFAAFPGTAGTGASGMGGGAVGAGHAGTFSTVYHVTSTGDSGPGTLRDAVSTTNCTVVFDVSGTINLLSPLIITNSYLTIAGQTAPGEGITVAGNLTTVQSAHDVIIRDVRFRSGGASASGFESALAADYTSGQTIGGWTVLSNQVSVIADPVNAYQGSNFMALANGAISNSIATVPGELYTLTFYYRGPGIVGWWRGENTTNSSVYDNNPTNAVNITYASGMVGNAMSFDGSTSLVTMPPSASLTVSNLTFEGWIYPGTQYGPFIEYGGAGQNSPVHFWVNGAGFGSLPGQLYANMRTPSPDLSIQSAGGLFPANAWSHVTYTVDTATHTARLYCNGVQVAIKSIASPINPATFAPVNLGYRDINSSDVYRGYLFSGRMDEVSIYNRALSLSEIKAIYQNATNGKFDPVEFNISPSESLAEANVSVPGVVTNVFIGNNTNWQQQSFTFRATGAATPVVIRGLEPGMLIDFSSGNPVGALQFNTASNVLADHISTAWSVNNDVSVLGSTNLTVQWSILADSLYQTNNPPSRGSLLRYGNGALSFNHNLYANNFSGNPRLGDNLSLDFVNNVIYNWGLFSGFAGGTNDLPDNPDGSTNRLNYVCNYLIAGADTSLFATNYAITNIAFFGGNTNSMAANWIFQTNNFIDSNTNGILDGANTKWAMFTNRYTKFEHPFPLIPVPTDEAFLAYEKVLDFAGVNMGLRDSVDTNIVAGVRTQTGRLITAPGTLPLLGSVFPYLDTDQDGIPDFWEMTFTPTNVYVPSNNNDRNGDGYTDLEEYNNWLAEPHAVTVTNTDVGVDLLSVFGKTGNLSFFVTNGVNGSVYLTNVLNDVTNVGTYSNSIAWFTPTNDFGGGTNYGYASFDVFVTNNDTIAYFGPVSVSVIVAKQTVSINTNMPPDIITLTNGTTFDPTNYGGSQFYHIVVNTNDYGALFELDDRTGPLALVVKKGLPLPSLSDYDYMTNAPVPPTNETIVVFTNSSPVPLSPGDWYMAAVNVAGSNVYYTAKVSLLHTLLPPVFLSPTNGDVFTNIETTLFTTTCSATDPNSPTLPLTYALVSGPTNVVGATNVMTVDAYSGLINWTPNEAQGPSTNTIEVSVSNGAFTVTNSFTIIVEESNLPPVQPIVPGQVAVVPGQPLVVTNTTTDPDIPDNPLTYTLSSTVAGTNVPVIDPNTGIITWSPTRAQAGTSYVFTTVVTDTNPWAINTRSFSVTNSFGVTVTYHLGPEEPDTNTVPAGGIHWLTVNVPTNAVYATNTLLFATNQPVNLWFSTNVPPTTGTGFELLTNATSGVSVLTPSSSPAFVPGGTYFLGVENPNAVGVAYAVKVDFLLQIPVSSIVHTNLGGTNGFLLTWFAPSNYLFQVQWTDSLQPINWNSFSNIVSYNPAAFNSPTNTQFNFFDDGTQSGGFGPMRFYRLLLLQSVNLLTFPSPGDLTVNTNTLVTVTNTATETDASAVLTYSLLESPAGAAIDSTNGVITWTASPAGLAARFVTKVSDDRTPPAFATNMFTVFVTPLPAINNALVTTTNFTLNWTAPTNDQFQVRWTTNLTPPVAWSLLPDNGVPATITSTNGAFSFTDTNDPATMKFYQLILLP